MVGGTSQQVLDNLRDIINAVYRLKDRGQLHWALGTRVQHYANGSISMDQSLYIKSMAEKFKRFKPKKTYTPMKPNERLRVADCPIYTRERLHVPQHEYRAITGNLLYAANMTRPDIAYAVSQC